MTAFVGASEGLLGLGQSVVRRQQHADLERAVGVAPPIGADIRLHRGVDIASLLQQHPELRCGTSVTALIGPREGSLCVSHPVVLNQQHGKLKRPVGIAARISSDICGGRTLDIAPLLQEHPAVKGCAPVTALVCVL